MDIATLSLSFSLSLSVETLILVFNCCHFATDCLYEYVQFMIYCIEAQLISAVSPNICTLKLQLIHNTERPTKWSGHGKMSDPPGELLHMTDLLPKRVTI